MIDVVKLFFKAGNGGDGRLSFYRAKFVPKGGPDGGDGGNGGSIYLVGDAGVNTLKHFAGKKGFKAMDGEMGGKSSMYGRKGEDLYIKVPVGTVVWKIEHPEGEAGVQPEFGDPNPEGYYADDSEVTQQNLKHLRLEDIQKTKVVEILADGQEYLLCKGGKGGKGNESFKSSRNTTPMETQKGEPGQEIEALIELKLLADVGLVGFPNAGKSSFLARVTKANPRIANYPFTTIEPNLGVMDLGQGKEAVLADIPGIIEGASIGKGLGFQFFRHIERCSVLIFVLFLEESDIFDETLSDQQKAEKLLIQYELLSKELRKYSEQLVNLPSVVIVSKADLYQDELRSEIERQLRGKKLDFLFWSGVTKEGYESIQKKLIHALG